MDSAILAEAARYERDRRARSYPPKIAALAPVGLEGSADKGCGDAEALTIDYQCWVAIAEWLESGNFSGFYGGAEPEGGDAPYILWPHLEAGAQGALEQVTAKIDRMEDDPHQQRIDPAKRLTAGQYLARLSDLYIRRARLVCIHRKVQLRRQMIDSINAEFRNRRETEIAA